jgi:hypothetical protein
LVQEAWKATTTTRQGVNEMECIAANTTLNLYCGGLQETEEVEYLEAH